MTEPINLEQDVLERFIPVDLGDLINDLTASEILPGEQAEQFRKFAQAYVALYHAQTQQKLIKLKRAYQPFNPDRDTILTAKKISNANLDNFKSLFFSTIEQANYEKMSESSLNDALNKISPHGVKVSVDFNEFEAVHLYYRGSAVRTETHRNWRKLFLRKQSINVQIYRRLFVLLQPRTREQWIEYLRTKKHYGLKKAIKKADASLKTLGIDGDHQVVYIKMFKDIPKADLEMLFPNTRIQIKLFDKLKLGIMGGGGTAGGIMVTISKVSAAVDLTSALIAVGGLIGILWRQITKIFSQRTKYSAILAKNLYFYSLANNLSALTYLADTAEAEECKEALLSYFFLLKNRNCNRKQLDKSIEEFVQTTYSIPMNFEIEDGLEKLNQYSLLQPKDCILSATPITQAILNIQHEWGNILVPARE